MRHFISLVLALGMSFPGIVVSSTWQDYLSTQDGEADWANTVRGAARGKTGLAILKGSTGETYNFLPLLESLEKVTSTKDLIMPIGGLGSGRRQDLMDNYMRMIRYDDGKRWRRLVSEQVTAVAARFPQRDAYWQIGNEINSWHFVESMSPWKDSTEIVSNDPIEDIRLMERGSKDERKSRREDRKKSKGNLKKLKRNNSIVIPLYVEYFLAPTALAIMDARKQAPESAGRIKIVLGSIANSHSGKARSWLESLLNYEIRGDYAEQLAGMKVSEVINIVALHYMVSGPGSKWRDAFPETYGQWMGKGSINGIWSTEEIGRKRATAGLGGATAIIVLARYTDLWHELGINPQQGRANFWGWKLGDRGTRAGEAMQTLTSLIGDTSLIPNHDQEINWNSTGNYESYIFKTTQDKLVLVQFAADKSSHFGFHGFQTKWNGEGEPRVKVIVFGQRGQQELEPEIILESGILTVNTSNNVSPRDVVLIIVDRD